jgi:hypothetical protein
MKMIAMPHRILLFGALCAGLGAAGRIQEPPHASGVTRPG